MPSSAGSPFGRVTVRKYSNGPSGALQEYVDWRRRSRSPCAWRQRRRSRTASPRTFNHLNSVSKGHRSRGPLQGTRVLEAVPGLCRLCSPDRMATVKSNVTIDCTMRERMSAQLRVKVTRILNEW